MGAIEAAGRPGALLRRAAAVLVRPKRTWAVIAEEPASLGDIYRGYVLPLAAIPPACAVVGGLLFGAGIGGIQIRPTARGLVAGAAVDYLAALAAVFLLSRLIAAVAPLFGGVGDRRQALKLAAYSGTAFWASGVFGLLPSLGFAVMILAALYSLYTLREGLPVLMRLPEAKALTGFAAIVLMILVLAVGMGAASAALRSLVGGPLQVVASPAG